MLKRMKEDSLYETVPVISTNQTITSFYSSGRLQIMVAWHNADDPETDARWDRVDYIMLRDRDALQLHRIAG